MRNEIMPLGLLVIGVFLLYSVGAVPVPPSPVCNVTGEILEIERTKTNFSKFQGSPRQPEDFEYYAVDLNITNISTQRQDGNTKCDNAYIANAEHDGQILHLNEHIEGLAEDQWIKAKIERRGDEFFAGFFLTDITILNSTLNFTKDEFGADEMVNVVYSSSPSSDPGNRPYVDRAYRLKVTGPDGENQSTQISGGTSGTVGFGFNTTGVVTARLYGFWVADCKPGTPCQDIERQAPELLAKDTALIGKIQEPHGLINFTKDEFKTGDPVSIRYHDIPSNASYYLQWTGPKDKGGTVLARDLDSGTGELQLEKTFYKPGTVRAELIRPGAVCMKALCPGPETVIVDEDSAAIERSTQHR